jgi:ankyrin repeat protein
LLKEGADINAQDARGRTALLAAVEGNHLESAQVLIEAGADVNVQDHKM